jgi:hypothetical protein
MPHINDSNSDDENMEEIDIDDMLGQKYFTYPLKHYDIDVYQAKIELVNYFKKLSVNRNLVEDHWKQIYNEQKNNLIKGTDVYFSGIITVCFWENNMYVIDGQHRVKAMQELFDKCYNNKKYKKYRADLDNIFFRLDFIEVNEYKDMIEIIQQINTVVQLDIVALKLQAKNNIRNYFKTKFKSNTQSILSSSKKPIRPKINETLLLNKISKYERLINLDSKTLYKLIDVVNKKYSEMDDYGLMFDNNTISASMMRTAKKFGCYLGFDTKFWWVEDMDDMVSDNMNNYGLTD